MPELVLVFAALLSSAGPQSIRVGLDQVPPGSKCVQSAVLASFAGQPASAELGAEMMAAARSPKLKWISAAATDIPKHDSKLLIVRLDAQNRVVSANCASGGGQG